MESIYGYSTKERLMAKDETQKHTLNLFAGDYEKIQALYPDVGAAPVIRRIVRAFIEQVEAGSDSPLDAAVEVKI